MNVARNAGVCLVTTEVDAGNPGIIVYLKKGFQVCGMTLWPATDKKRPTTLTLCYNFCETSS